MHNIPYIKKKLPTDILYLMVFKREELFNIIVPPELNSLYFDILKYLPKNLHQLEDTTTHIASCWDLGILTGYDLHIIYEDYAKDYIENLDSRQLVIAFIDDDISSKPELISLLKSRGFCFYLYAKNDSAPNLFSNPIDLIDRLTVDIKTIESHFAKFGKSAHHFSIGTEVPESYIQLNKYKFFIPSASNFFMLNQYVGNIWHDPIYKKEISLWIGENWPKEEKAKQLAESSKQTNRIRIIEEQITNIDKFRVIILDELLKEKTLSSTNPFTPLIIVSPYQYPKISEIIPRVNELRPFVESYRAEQDLDYRISIDAKDKSNEEILELLSFNTQIIQSRMSFLDTIAYLHASFTFSPVLRLPLKGKSINKYLSFFNPDGPNIKSNKLFKSILKFGKQYIDSAMSKELQRQIKTRNRQLVFISDLPCDWFCIDDVPLSFTHDVTRIPETPYGGIMSFYMRNQLIDFKVEENILQNTLIVFGAPTSGDLNNDFKTGYNFIQERSKQLGFKTCQCNNIQELKEAIETHNPSLLIFDTHGNTNPASKSTELQMGSELLTGEEIVKHKIFAPLIILSACSTSPNWGYLNPIANAFFEAGALSVTGTYLPIGIHSGTIFYHRILTNLAIASTKAIHSNWLNFVSHNIRTHYISEIALDVQGKIEKSSLDSKSKIALHEQVSRLWTTLLNEAMPFNKRRAVFEKTKQAFLNIHPAIRIDISHVRFEQLLYTNLGRGDMIRFSSWMKAQKKLD